MGDKTKILIKIDTVFYFSKTHAVVGWKLVLKALTGTQAPQICLEVLHVTLMPAVKLTNQKAPKEVKNHIIQT